MRIHPECHSCLSRLAVQASSSATDDVNLKEHASREAHKELDERFLPGELTVVIACAIHDAIRRITGNHDPYRRMKDIELETARRLYNDVKGRFSEDFSGLLKLAAIGNAIDFFRPIEEVERDMDSMHVEFTIDDSFLLEEKVKKSRFMIYLADNAGEVFFDMPLLKLMRRHGRTVYVVKESPVQNDITMEEVKRAGIDTGETMTTGTATPGVDFNIASEEFKKVFQEADFVLAKGMGYYETLEELPAQGRILFCLKAKCGPVAESLKVPLNSYVAMLR